MLVSSSTLSVHDRRNIFVRSIFRNCGVVEHSCIMQDRVHGFVRYGVFRKENIRHSISGRQGMIVVSGQNTAGCTSVHAEHNGRRRRTMSLICCDEILLERMEQIEKEAVNHKTHEYHDYKWCWEELKKEARR